MNAHASEAGEGAFPPSGRVRVAIEVEIPSDVRYIDEVVALVTRHCQDFDFPSRLCSLNVPVALTEAISNAILRGNLENHDKHVRVRAFVDAEQLVMEVADEGRGFDLERCTIDPTTPENVVREDGRGLFLMRKLMDSVEQVAEHGNVLRLTLHRA